MSVKSKPRVAAAATAAAAAAAASQAAAALLVEHDIWERTQQEEIAKRLGAVEKAVVQINHFTEMIEKLDLPRWAGNVDGQLMWIRVLVGATAVAAVGQLVVSLLRGG